MKKIGIVSIFRTGNYGGTLQAYALKKAINDNGLGDAEIINYTCDAIRGKIDVNYLKKAGVLRTAAAVVDKLAYLPRMKKVNAFIEQMVNGKELTREELGALNGQYDLFLSGSDQLWNPDIQQGDYYYLQDFVVDPDKKRSYASSFGKKKLPDAVCSKYKELLSEYRFISVREQAGADIIQKLLGYTPEIVVDPVFLLGARQWESLLAEPLRKDSYIFAYRLTYSRLLTEVVAAAQKQLNKNVAASPFLLGYLPHTKKYPALSSLEWVRAIYDSSYVIADSFHAVAFAIIFSKPFYYVVTTATVRERLSRLETLLQNLGIEDRIVENVAQCDFSKEIDYVRVQERLEGLQEHAMEVLRMALQA